MMEKQLLLLVIFLLPMVASAHDIEVQNGDGVTIYYNYTNDSTELSVTFRGDSYIYYSNEYTGNVVIPEEVTYMNSNHKVTGIGDWAFYYCTSLTSVTISNSVTSIGSNAFSNCYRLTSITIPNSVTSVGSNAFDHCHGLTSVTIGNSLTSIGDWTFYYCTSLTSVTISNSVTNIGSSAFYNCSGLTSITIPNSVTSIGGEAFYNCSGLTSITIPNSVTSIGSSAFNGCRIENVLTRNCKTACSGAFSDRTYQHAMLYVPEGAWAEAVYDGSWYRFNNIREVAMNKENLSPAKAYVLMDLKSFGYAVFDGTNIEVKIAKAFYSIDENDLNNCWQVIDKSGVKYLYNVGAEKYAKISSDGKIILTDNEIPVNITEGKNGLMFGSDTSREWGLVKNNNVNIDSQTGINPVCRTNSDSNPTYFLINGQQTTQPKKGLSIVRMSDGTTKKIVVR